MISSFFHTVLYLPIYNLLFFLIDIVPGGDIGLAVVIATVLVKIVLMPLSLSAARTQRRMKHVEPHIKAIRENHKDNKEEQAKQTMALYKEHGIRPFSSILGALLQFPIVIALYWVTRKALNSVDPSLLYPFVHAPAHVSPLLLGLFPVVGHSLILAVIAAAAQFVNAYFSIPVPKAEPGSKPTATEDFGRMMAVQARFVLPLIIGVAAYSTSGAVALYFITSSIVAVIQEFIVRRTKHPVPAASA